MAPTGLTVPLTLENPVERLDLAGGPFVQTGDAVSYRSWPFVMLWQVPISRLDSTDQIHRISVFRKVIVEPSIPQMPTVMSIARVEHSLRKPTRRTSPVPLVLAVPTNVFARQHKLLRSLPVFRLDIVRLIASPTKPPPNQLEVVAIVFYTTEIDPAPTMLAVVTLAVSRVEEN